MTSTAAITCAIAAPHALAGAAASRAVGRGGNAIDAALAAAATLAVVYPHNTALGGDLVALVRTPGSPIRCVNATGPAPRAADRAAIAARHAGTMPLTGPDTVTVPGVVAGWAALHVEGARLAWPEHFAAAIEHASGTPVVPGLAGAISRSGALIGADPGMRAVFAPGGRPLTAGDLLRQDALRATLSAIAAGGADVLYGGEVGAHLVAGLRRLGSPIDLEDLRAYEMEVGAPLCRGFRGRQVYTSPPNTQGFLLLQALMAVADADTGESADLLGAAAGSLAAVFGRGILDRGRYLADPRFVPVDVDALLDPGRPRLAAGGNPGPAVTTRPAGDTVAVVTADSDGYAVSLIQSLFHGFGSGLLEPATGILTHNRGSFFSLDPAAPNVLAPGKRPAHTLMPVMVTAGDRLAWVNGTMGGRAQPQIHTQVLLRLLDGATPADAVAAPRWVVGGPRPGGREDTVSVEAGVPAPARAALAATGMPVVDLPAGSDPVGHAQVVARYPDGTLLAGSDQRADGAAVLARRGR